MDINDKLDVLFLTFWSPPLVRPRAIAIGKLMPEFIRQGINPVIITYENGGHWEIDAPIYKIPQFRENKFLSAIKLRSISKYLYYRMIRRLGEELIMQYKIDVIFSFSNPQESNIAGAMIRKKTGVPFVSYFSDPWYDSPYKHFSRIAAQKVLRLERFVIKNSDRALFINEAEKRVIMRKLPAKWHKKGGVVHHCYDPADYPPIQKKANEKFTFSYIGTFYKQRDPEVFFKGVKEAIRRYPQLRSKIKIQIVGGVNEYFLYPAETLYLLINKYGFNELVEIQPPVDYKKSLEYMKLADCLVAIDADVSESVYSPSKLFDYAGSGTPIIGITPTGGPTHKFLSSLGYCSFNYSQTEELADYIKRLVNKEITPLPNREVLKKFDVRHIASQYISIFREVAAKNSQNL